MALTLTVRDETTSGDTLREFALELLTERITVRELIRSRVYQEVQDFNRLQPQIFHGLVQPTEAEKSLNGYKLTKSRTIDWKKQYARAIEAAAKAAITTTGGAIPSESCRRPPRRAGPYSNASFHGLRLPSAVRSARSS